LVTYSASDSFVGMSDHKLFNIAKDLIKELQENGPDLELAFHDILNNDKMPDYIDLLRTVNLELSKGTPIFEIENNEQWFRVQDQLTILLMLLLNERT
jgi:hypothetical protein